VKFVKRNFAKHRVFSNIDSWNEKCLSWLDRTGNYNVHNTTKKRPVEVHALEKQHLKPVPSLLSFESYHGSSISRTVHKDNVIKYKSNRYSVPVGTYRPRGDNTVYIDIQEEELIIRCTPQGEILAKHQLSLGKGELIKNRNHTRDRSKGIQAFRETIIRQFDNQESAELFLHKIADIYPRYMRDQLQVIQHTITHYRSEVGEALEKCIQDQLWSANDFRDLAQHFTRLKESKPSNPQVNTEIKSNTLALKATATTRDMDNYIRILEGVS
jgi:hypothetical protein